MTEDEVRDLVRQAAAYVPRPLTERGLPRSGAYGLRAWCHTHGVASAHASEFLNGKRGPGTDLLNALGLEYRIVHKAQPDHQGETP